LAHAAPPYRGLLFACYAGLAAALFVIASLGHDLVLVAATCAVLGTCLIGAQFVLYGLAPSYYQTITGERDGRLRSRQQAGLGGRALPCRQLLGAGATATQVLQSLLPMTAAAAIAALLLMFCHGQMTWHPEGEPSMWKLLFLVRSH